MAELKPTGTTPEAPKSLPTTESVIANPDIRATQVDLPRLTAEISDITDSAKLEAVKTWILGQLDASNTRLSRLEAELTDDSDDDDKEYVDLQRQKIQKLQDAAAKVELKSVELKLQEPFSVEELFSALESARNTNDLAPLNVAIEKLKMQIKAEVLAEVGQAPRVDSAPAEAAAAGEAATQTTTEATSTSEAAPQDALSEAIAKLNKLDQDHPKNPITKGLGMMVSLSKTPGMKKFGTQRIMKMAEAADTYLKNVAKAEKYKPVTEVLKSSKLKNILSILSKAEKKADGTVSPKGISLTVSQDAYEDLTAQLLFMAEELHAIATPDWIGDETKGKLHPKMAAIRELMKDNPTLVEEFYTDPDMMAEITKRFPALKLAAAPDAAPASVPAKAEPVAPAVPAATPDAAAAKPEPAAPEATDKVMTVEALAKAFHVDDARLNLLRAGSYLTLYDADALRSITKKDSYDSATMTIILAALDMANSTNPQSTEARALLTKLAK